jgi:hypothetical protein
MHESDAMEFIDPVLSEFLDRTFENPDNVDTYDLYQPHLKKIRAFIKDNTGHWVKEKALWVIHFIETMETQIRLGRYEPVSPESCVDTVLNAAHKRMADLVDGYRLEINPNRIQDFFPLPVLPKKK